MLQQNTRSTKKELYRNRVYTVREIQGQKGHLQKRQGKSGKVREFQIGQGGNDLSPEKSGEIFWFNSEITFSVFK